jgi:hypothetical protein
MFNIKNLFGLNVCCYKKFLKNKCHNLITIVNIGIVYNFGLTIFNHSYNISHNFTNSILYMDDIILAKAILELFKLMFLMIAICFWCSISDLLLELFNCSKKH